MDLRYISANKLLLIYGFLGTVLCSITCIITTLKECEETKNKNKTFYDYICILNNEENKTKKYFDSFSIYFSNFKIEEIIRLFFQILFYFLNKYFSILIIKYFTPVHLILSFPVYYFIQKIVLIINTLRIEGHFFKDTKSIYKIVKFCLDISGDITSIIGFLFYLEIIQLNFCNFNYNLRRNIINRGNMEVFIDNDDFDDEIKSDFEEF